MNACADVIKIGRNCSSRWLRVLRLMPLRPSLAQRGREFDNQDGVLGRKPDGQ